MSFIDKLDRARVILERQGRLSARALGRELEVEAEELEELIERSGATTVAPAFCEWRAELAAVLGDEATRVQFLQEAQQGYDEIGAPLQAARIARELDA